MREEKNLCTICTPEPDQKRICDAYYDEQQDDVMIVLKKKKCFSIFSLSYLIAEFNKLKPSKND